MKLGIFSDTHANLEALTAVLLAFERAGVDELVCLGDTVGYGANPNECLTLVRELTPHILLGNHDEAAIYPEKTEHFNPLARIASEWTGNTLTEANKAFIQDLPFSIERHGATFVHSSPYEPAEWHYILSPADAQYNFQSFQTPICFIGHTHVPDVFCDDIWTREVIRSKRFVVNVGSVGQPRDNNWQLSFGVFDTDKWTYKNIRSEYDVKTASEKIRKAGLPRGLADRILVGR